MDYRRGNKQDEAEYLPYHFYERSKCESPIERRLYDTLINNGYYAKTQVQCGRYRIDIALPGDLIAIECDGKAYHSTPQQKANDRRKDRYLRKNGWRVIRVSGRRIYRDIGGILHRIEKEVTKKAPV